MREPHNIRPEQIYRDALGRFSGIHPDFTRIVNLDMITPAYLDRKTPEEIAEELRTAGAFFTQETLTWVDVNGYQMAHSLALNTIYVRRTPDTPYRK